MKHATYCTSLAIAILLGVLFGTGVSAESVLQDVSTSTPRQCLLITTGGVDTGCDSFENSTSNTVHFVQETIIQPNIFNRKTLDISAVSFYVADNDGNTGNWTGTAYLYDSENKSVATSSSQSITSVGEWKFEFSPSHRVEEGEEVLEVKLILAIPNPARQLQWQLTPNLYPPIGNPDTHVGKWCNVDLGHGNCAAYEYEDAPFDWDFAIKIYDEANVLEFTYPANQQTVNDLPLKVLGVCSSQLDWALYNSLNIASSTVSLGGSETCSSDSFAFDVYLDQGWWTATASSVTNFTTSTFFFLAQNLAPIGDTTSPLDDEDGAVDGYWGFIWQRVIQYMGQRPFVYLSQVQNTFITGISTSTATTTLVADITFQTASTAIPFTLPGINTGQFTDLISQASWDTLRPFFVSMIYIAFIIYAYRRVKSII